MNKQDLVGAVADRTGLGRLEAGRAVDAVFDAITASLKAGDEVRVVGFGSFHVSHREASTGRNPRTGEPMDIRAGVVAKFKVGKGLKDACNDPARETGQPAGAVLSAASSGNGRVAQR